MMEETQLKLYVIHQCLQSTELYELLTFRDVVSLSGFGIKTVTAWCKSGELLSTETEFGTFIKTVEWNRFVDERTTHPFNFQPRLPPTIEVEVAEHAPLREFIEAIKDLRKPYQLTSLEELAFNWQADLSTLREKCEEGQINGTKINGKWSIQERYWRRFLVRNDIEMLHFKSVKAFAAYIKRQSLVKGGLDES